MNAGWLSAQPVETMFGPTSMQFGVDSQGVIKVRVGALPLPAPQTIERAALIGAVHIIGRVIESQARGKFVKDSVPPTFTLPGKADGPDKEVEKGLASVDLVLKAVDIVGAFLWFGATRKDVKGTVNFVVVPSKAADVAKTVKRSADMLEKYLRIRASPVYWGVLTDGDRHLRVYKHPVKKVAEFDRAEIMDHDGWEITPRNKDDGDEL